MHPLTLPESKISTFSITRWLMHHQKGWPRADVKTMFAMHHASLCALKSIRQLVAAILRVLGDLEFAIDRGREDVEVLVSPADSSGHL